MELMKSKNKAGAHNQQHTYVPISNHSIYIKSNVKMYIYYMYSLFL